MTLGIIYLFIYYYYYFKGKKLEEMKWKGREETTNQLSGRAPRELINTKNK